MARILVTEKIADGGLDRLRDAGHDVDVQLGLSAEELLATVPGAHALIIRSATTVTAEVLAAGTDLVVVGRAGIGLDNVDVDAATARGRDGGQRPAVQHPLGRRAHHGAAAGPGPQHPPGPRRAGAGPVGALASGTGVELSDKTLGIIGLGRIGKLVAQRALAFGMRLVGLRPVRVGRAGPADERRAASTSTS